MAGYGSLIKGHYTDWVANAQDYPAAGMGGANVGPEFTAVEYDALVDLAAKESALLVSRPQTLASGMLQSLEDAVLASNRWQKWLQPDERHLAFADLSPQRRAWLVRTGARYIWMDAPVLEARRRLYANLSAVMPNPNQYVVERIAAAIDRYVNRFGLFDANRLLTATPTPQPEAS